MDKPGQEMRHSVESIRKKSLSESSLLFSSNWIRRVVYQWNDGHDEVKACESLH